MLKWEYLIIDIASTRDGMRPESINGQKIRNFPNVRTFNLLNELGDNGWELIGIRAQSAPNAMESIFLKRQKE